MDSKNLSRSEAARRARLVSDVSYRLELDLSRAQDPDRPHFGSRTTVSFSCARPGESTFLDFLHGGVDSVELNGTLLDPETVVGEHRIHLPDLRERNTAVVSGRGLYSTSGEGLHRFVDPADGETYLYTQYEPADARRVFANFEQPDLKAAYDVVVTAPADWHVASNGAVASVDDNGDGTATWHFRRTEPMSTYLTAVLAGPYHYVTDQWTGTTADGGTLSIDLGASCRASLAKDFDADRIFEVTKSGLDLFHRLFQYPYPWGKYDQAFVPEYNLGAMENPGLVTFTERYVFTSRATAAQHEGRANTLMHEMAHMWFGDLVTMEWWDDLWLKESFADYMGALATERATDLGQPWVTFANRRKAWAYVQDQLPSTHPIVADIPDVEAARQNFDGITYAKGASVLKQLAAYVGEDAFFTAARRYFAAHAFGNTTLDDFLAVLAEASGRDMREWSAAWLETAGVADLRVLLETDDDGVVTSAVLEQQSVDPVTGREVLRPHVLRVGTWDVEDGRLRRTGSHAVELTGVSVPVPGLVGGPRPAVVLPNDEDLTYGKVEFDEVSLATVLARVAELGEPLAEATAWAALWNMVRDAKLPATEFADAVLRFAPSARAVGVLQLLLEQTTTALEYYAPSTVRGGAIAALTTGVLDLLGRADPGSDHQVALARAFARLARHGAEQATVGALLEADRLGRRSPIAGLEVDEQLRWALLQAGAAAGRIGQDELDAALGTAPSAVAAVGHATATAARPVPEVKAAAWRSVLTGRTPEGRPLSNDVLSATAAGFQIGAPELTAGHYDEYWPALAGVWDSLSNGQASRIIQGLFPLAQDIEAAPGDGGTGRLGVEDGSAARAARAHPVVQRAHEWLAEHEAAPAALRRLLVEQTHTLERTLTAQAAAVAVPVGSERAV
ncbi:aminopeptidase N [Zhihengliuella sp.]|uniref:aminopeptidase N n=1 Tax=Zhihengliuella sp. TaxID=1954483 RepID=UPI002811E49D|nr:aminopeptidase N [Zhihengliuella sp.]